MVLLNSREKDKNDEPAFGQEELSGSGQIDQELAHRWVISHQLDFLGTNF
jgi:hypothetical protein